MAEKDINDYLKKQIAGNPELNTKAKKDFLGVLEERIRVYILLKDTVQPIYLKKIEQILTSSPGGKIRLSVALDTKTRLKFIKIAQKYNVPFTMVDNDSLSETPSDAGVGMVYHFEQLVEQPVRDIAKLN